MSIPILVLIMLVTGFIGGSVNYLLPSNTNETNQYIKPWWHCVSLGIAATLLIPLFLEIAQSKLLDDTRFDFSWEKPATAPASDMVRITTYLDSAKRAVKTDTAGASKPKPPVKSSIESTGKYYLLFAAYCLVAAYSGLRFINMLINSVVKEEQLSKVKNVNARLQRQLTKRIKNSLKSQEEEESSLKQEFKAQLTLAAQVKGDPSNFTPLPTLPSVQNPDDPQKGRFGGQAERNNRKLDASVERTSDPDWFRFWVWVESTDKENNPLTGDVVFYLHDSFSPSIYIIKPHEFSADGRAGIRLSRGGLISYGAFTVGAVADNGATSLELDLSQDQRFPKEFRER